MDILHPCLLIQAESMKNKNDIAVLPFNSKRIRNKYIVSNVMGCWDILTISEFSQFNALSLRRGKALTTRLYERGLIVDSNNLEKVMGGFRSLNANLFNDTSLHIAVLTRQCNLSCAYCQSGNGDKSENMTLDVASRILKYLFDVRSKAVTLEFQGGEPVVNWPILEFLVDNARKFNTSGKELTIVLVTNMLLLDDAKMAFLAKNDVKVCASLDGPEDIHDKNRVYRDHGGTYRDVIGKIIRFQERFGRKVSLLPTITKFSLKDPERIIDEYVRLGQEEIALRPANCMGAASDAWSKIGYTPEEFCGFYKRALDYIVKINGQGKLICERTARIILMKMLLRKDPGYVEMMSPCGAGRATMVYMPDGAVYPCDEARMLGEDMFRLGDVVKEEYDDILNKENLLNLLQASCVNLWHYSSVFSPWIGYCPVVNYAEQKNIVPRVSCSALQKIQLFQFEEIVSRFMDGAGQTDVLNRWIEGNPHEGKKNKIS